MKSWVIECDPLDDSIMVNLHAPAAPRDPDRIFWTDSEVGWTARTQRRQRALQGTFCAEMMEERWSMPAIQSRRLTHFVTCFSEGSP